MGLDPLEDEALAITRKNRKDLAKAPLPKTVWKKFSDFVNKYNFKKTNYYAPLAAGYNIIGFDMLCNFNIPVIICEGAFDAISIKRNAVPLFGKRISKSLYKELVRGRVKQIYLALDQDAIKRKTTNIPRISRKENLISIGYMYNKLQFI